ncbi:MAG TPA: SDR family oxidoreductase, partial [Gemmatimonadaceae bacterium]|nr:SDR family oxidoreductase [Gemmatimonadaceae bacterium]
GGFAMSGPLDTSSVDEWERQHTINLRTAYLTVRSMLPMVRSAKGAVVFFASAVALPGAKTAGMAAYATAKAGVVALMQSVAQQERDTGVRVNAIAPTTIRTTSNVQAMGEHARYVEREAVAGVVQFLCSPGAASISGQLIRLE